MTEGPSRLQIYVDADACPVKDEVLKVAERLGLKTYFVCDGGLRPPNSPLAELVVVTQGADAADDWIADHIQAGDVAVTNDIPLADRCIKQGAAAIRPNGKVFSEQSIGMELATRDLMSDLREAGTITGGPPPFSKRDRSTFLQNLDSMIRSQQRR